MILFSKEQKVNILKNMDQSLNFVGFLYPNQYERLKLLNKEIPMFQQKLKPFIVSRTDQWMGKC